MLGIVYTHDSAILLLCIYPKDIPLLKKTVAQFFSIMARNWKQPKCPSTEECIKGMGYIYIMEYYSAIEFSRQMDGTRKYYSE